MKKILCLSMVFFISVSLFAPASAINIPHVVNAEDQNTLLEIGIPESIIEIMSNKDAQELIQYYLENPNAISVSTTTMEIDCLSELNTFINATDEELAEMGLSDEDINQMENQVMRLNEMTDDSLKSTFNINDNTVQCIRATIDPDSVDIVPYGNISTSKLTFTQVVVTRANLSRIDYLVKLYFNWDSTYFWTAFNDKIVTAWGGNLNQSVDLSEIRYSLQDENGWKPTIINRLSPDYTELSINAGGYFEFPQAYFNNHGFARSGQINYILKQNSVTGDYTKVLSQYAHQVLKVGTTGISVSASGASVSISIGTAYDKSAQNEDTITY